MKKLLYFFAIQLSVTAALAQTDVELNNALISGNNLSPRIDEIPYIAKKETTGRYIQDDWQTGTLMTEAGWQIEQMPMRYNITFQRLELKMENGEIKALPMHQIKEFKLTNAQKGESYFFNNHHWRHEEVPISGIFEVVKKGDVTLFCHYQSEIKDPNYVPQLHVGERDETAILKKTYYLGRGNELFKITPSDKKALEWLGMHPEEMRDFMKKYSLHFAQTEDLPLIVGYYNQLMQGNG